MGDFRQAALAGFVAAALMQAVPAAAQEGDAERGAALAEAWCVGCHVIDRKGTGMARDAAPTFPSIATSPAGTPDFLRGWLQGAKTHVQMPDLNLGRRDTEDLIAYFRSLARQ